jgi:hypothetical protein
MVHSHGLAIWSHPESINPLNAELNPICHLLALLGAHHIFHVSGLRVKSSTQTCVLFTGVALLGYYEECSGNYLQTFRDNL